jgi:3',5'-cyclic AMP phosphodiesterase CpdA
VYRLAHVTDPHFRSFDGARMVDFMGKRAIGALNLVVNRRRKHKMELLSALAADLRDQRPDHLALTGDLSNVALEAEWRAALHWIEGLGADPQSVTVIPGNHDAYVPDVVDRGVFESMFGRYQTADVPGGTDVYPFLRLRGPVALVSVNSCVATRGLGAWGRIGDAQLERMEAALTSPAARERTRVVLLHHPPVRHKGVEDRNLRDRQAFVDALGRSGADLVLHGHDHEDESATIAGPDGRGIPVVGAGSASYSGGAARRARYNIYEFADGGITRITRAHDEATDTVREVRRDRL